MVEHWWEEHSNTSTATQFSSSKVILIQNTYIIYNWKLYVLFNQTALWRHFTLLKLKSFLIFRSNFNHNTFSADVQTLSCHITGIFNRFNSKHVVKSRIRNLSAISQCLQLIKMTSFGGLKFTYLRLRASYLSYWTCSNMWLNALFH